MDSLSFNSPLLFSPPLSAPFGRTNRPVTFPWEIALDEAIVTGGAKGSKDFPSAATKLATYLIGPAGYLYDHGGNGGSKGGAPGYCDVQDKNGKVNMDLQDYIERRGKHKGGNMLVSCQDQAGGLTSYVNLLGASGAVWYRGPRAGYLSRNQVFLVGRQMTTHPFFNNPDHLEAPERPLSGSVAHLYFSPAVARASGRGLL